MSAHTPGPWQVATLDAIAALEWPFEATPSELDTLLDAARAAIAKAEGES